MVYLSSNNGTITQIKDCVKILMMVQRRCMITRRSSIQAWKRNQPFQVHKACLPTPLQQIHCPRIADFAQVSMFFGTGLAQDLGMFEELEAFSVAREEGSKGEQFVGDAASGPDIDAAVVEVAA